jgi:DNA polymerase-3 subunit gamma/tau
MSYQVLARKWRPKQFSEMVGQGHVLKALVNALDDNRLHHAYLFTGTRGVGKTSIARLFAKALNCEQGVSSKPCGECSACVEIAEGRFVDLIEVDAASRTKVEDTRELLENVQYAPTRGRFKVYLIDEVHMLSKSSFNALLKTLEEPPPHVKFLLATTDPQKLPVTVLSRCLQFNLKNMIPQRIVEHLSTVLSAEQITFEEGALWLLARSADGSMRDALSLTDQSIAFGAGSVAETDVRVMLGTIDLQLVYKILDALVAGDGAGLLQCVENLAQFSPDYNTVLGDIVSLLHRIAIAQAVPSALDNSMGDKEQVQALSAQLCAEDVQLFYQIALMGRKDQPFVPDAREGLEMTLMRMLAFRPAQSSHIAPANIQNSVMQAPVIEPVIEAKTAESSAEQAQKKTSIVEDEQPAEVIQSTQNDVKVAATSALPQGLDSSSAQVNSAKKQPSDDEVVAVVAEVAKATEVNTPPAVDSISSANDDTDLANREAPHQQSVVIEKQQDQACTESSEIEQIAGQTSQLESPVVEIIKPEQAASVDTEQPPVISSSIAQERDIPPWEDDYASYQQQSEVEKNTAQRAEIKAIQPSAAEEGVTSQIDITKMLPAAVTEFSNLGLEDWPALVGSVGFTGMTAHIAENLSLESIVGNALQFNVSQVQKNVLDHTQKERIQSLISEYFNSEIQVGYESEVSTRETPWQCFEKLRAQRLKQAIVSFQTDEMVQQLVSVFSAEVDRSSIMPLDF